MREVMVPRYEAFDGEQFDSPAECRKHEDDRLAARLSGLTVDQVQAALDRRDLGLADAYERAGLTIRDARRKAGDLRRVRTKKAEPAAPEPRAN